MDNRKYNIYFHTHTVSGIIVCVLLYVVFFAGSFAFFKDDLAAWQKNSSYVANRATTQRNFNGLLDSLAKHHNLRGRDIEFFLNRIGMAGYVSMLPSNDSLVRKAAAQALAKAKTQSAAEKQKHGRGRGRGKGGDAAYFSYDFAQRKAVEYEKGYDMGEFMYRLHFLAPLNAIPLPINLGAPFGYLLAGIVSFIFLFALVTGLLLHWNKIVSNFFTFRPWSKWKTVWTDLHTALGVLQFPFQLLFAITGIVLIVNSVLLAPFARLAYNGESEQLYADLQTTDNTKYEYSYTPLGAPFDLNRLVAQVEHKWAGSELTRVFIRNYQDANMHVIVLAAPPAKASFSGTGKLVYRVRDQHILREAMPTEHSTYVSKVRSLIYHLHFGDFGGRPLRLMYFVLGAMGCVVIISGILIWLVARDKTSTPARERAFNFWTANIFLAISLSMLPVTAFTMIALLFVGSPEQSDIFRLYFYSWLALGAYFIVRQNITLTNRQTLMLSAGLCLLLPLLDGVVRNNWFWNTYAKGQFDILFVDLLFLGLGGISSAVLLRVRKRQAAPAAPLVTAAAGG